MPSIDRINYLNVGLMIVSCVTAYVFPFELFLLSYAVLGPLHYLTEISWLHERNYFTESGKGGAGGRVPRRGSPAPMLKRPNRAWLILVVITMSGLIMGFVAAEILHAPISPKWEITMFYLVLVTALLVTEIRNTTTKVVVFSLALASLALFSASRYYVILAFFLVTIIHVFVFTGAFILQGALKSHSPCLFFVQSSSLFTSLRPRATQLETMFGIVIAPSTLSMLN